jgi:hypothetical protein
MSTMESTQPGELPTTGLAHMRVVLRAVPSEVWPWIAVPRARCLARWAWLIVVGAGLYGAVLGAWREPLQSFFTSIKLPLVILLTTGGNALLNGMLAPLLGVDLSLRQSLAIVLLTFTIAAVLLGALAPVAAFIVWNLPPLLATTKASSVHYGLLQLVLVIFMAGCGAAGNVALLPTLRARCASARVARGVLITWLSTNLLLGSQISWVLRPFIWDPGRPVEFLGPEAWHGSFYETVFHAGRRLIVPP